MRGLGWKWRWLPSNGMSWIVKHGSFLYRLSRCRVSVWKACAVRHSGSTGDPRYGLSQRHTVHGPLQFLVRKYRGRSCETQYRLLCYTGFTGIPLLERCVVSIADKRSYGLL